MSPRRQPDPRERADGDVNQLLRDTVASLRNSSAQLREENQRREEAIDRLLGRPAVQDDDGEPEVHVLGNDGPELAQSQSDGVPSSRGDSAESDKENQPPPSDWSGLPQLPPQPQAQPQHRMQPLANHQANAEAQQLRATIANLNERLRIQRIEADNLRQRYETLELLTAHERQAIREAEAAPVAIDERPGESINEARIVRMIVLLLMVAWWIH